VAINFTGEFIASRSPEEVFEFLADPNKFGPLLPDFESMTVQDATHFTVKVRVGVGNVRGTAQIKMELAEATRPVRALYKGHGTAVGSQVTISAGFDLSPLPESTRVAWQGEANVFGKLASMAGGMLEPVGKKNIQKLIDGLRWELSKPVAGPEAVSAAPAPRAAIEAPAPAVEVPGTSPAISGPPETGAPAPAKVAELNKREGPNGAALMEDKAETVIPSEEVDRDADDRRFEGPV